MRIADQRKSDDCIVAICEMNFAALDLNLLRVFDAMMLDLNTTRAGERIGLSQPAVSAAIGRLRHITGDDLFVREGNRMVATTKACQLAEPIRTALHLAEEALSAVSRFEPENTERVFRISGSDYFSTLLMPGLASAVVPQAPRATVQMLDRTSADALRLLSEGAIDMGIDAEFALPDWAISYRLHGSFIATVARQGNRRLSEARVRPGDRLPPDLYCSLPHVIMSMDGSRSGTVDKVLSDRGLSRHVAMTAPHFQAVALTVSESDLLGSLPIHFARGIAKALNLDLYLPPFDPPILHTILFWHRRLDADAANIWLRQHVIQTMNLGMIDNPVSIWV